MKNNSEGNIKTPVLVSAAITTFIASTAFSEPEYYGSIEGQIQHGEDNSGFEADVGYLDFNLGVVDQRWEAWLQGKHFYMSEDTGSNRFTIPNVGFAYHFNDRLSGDITSTGLVSSSDSYEFHTEAGLSFSQGAWLGRVAYLDYHENNPTPIPDDNDNGFSIGGGYRPSDNSQFLINYISMGDYDATALTYDFLGSNWKGELFAVYSDGVTFAHVEGSYDLQNNWVAYSGAEGAWDSNDHVLGAHIGVGYRFENDIELFGKLRYLREDDGENATLVAIGLKKDFGQKQQRRLNIYETFFSPWFDDNPFLEGY